MGKNESELWLATLNVFDSDVCNILMQLEGSIQLSAKGIEWKRSGGGRTVEVSSEDIDSMMWTEIPSVDTGSGVKNSVLVVVRKKENGSLNLIGFPKSKLVSLQTMGLGEAKEVTMSSKGANWGNIEMQGANVVFKSNNMPLFVLPLSDALQAQHGRDEVSVQLPVDDTAVDRFDDALAGVTFYVPKGCSDFGEVKGEESEMPASKKMYDILKSFTMDVGTGDTIASFDSVGVLLPRGRFDIEMYQSSFHLLGQAHDFRVQYQSILRIFVLPRANAPQTIVAVALDPPLRKGQTTYTMVLCQFHNDEEMSIDLQVSDEYLTKLNEKGAKLTKAMTGPSPDVFAKTLRGLSGAKLTRTGAFRDATSEGHAVRCSYKNDDGFLYPLEKAFFYILKPPILIPYDDIRSVEFMRQSGFSASKTFDLVIKMKGSADDMREQQYQFRSIPRSEWTNLFEWIQAKNLRVENLKEVQQGPSGHPTFGEGMIGIDPALEELDGGGSDEDEFEEEDEDFEAFDSESDGDDSGLSDAEGAPETVPEVPKPKKRAKKEESGAAPKKRKKKDKNAPKKNMSAFMFYSNSVREKVKEENPGIAFGEVAKKISALWKELSDTDKTPYNEMAEKDKERYAKEMEAYKAAAGEPVPEADVKQEDSMDDDDDEDEDNKDAVVKIE